MINKLKTFINSHRKSFIIAVSSTLVAAVIAGSTLAYFIANSVTVANTFSTGSISCKIDEDFSDTTVKKDVRIKNTGKSDAFIRVRLVPSWENASGEAVPVKASLTDNLNISWSNTKDTDWIDGKDGYYYYKSSVKPGAYTSYLIKTATVKTANGNKMNLNVLAEAIQTAPNDTVKTIWKSVKVGNNGKLEAVK